MTSARGLFMEKEKWALPHQRTIFSADILTTLQKDNTINELKRELSEQRRYSAVLQAL